MTYGLVRKRMAFFVGVLLFLTILLTAFTFWLATGPRSITFVSNKIEELLDSISSEYDFSVGDTFLKLKPSGGGLIFEVYNLKVEDKLTSKTIALIPEIEVKLNMHSLFSGDLIVNNVVIKKTNLSFAIYDKLLSAEDKYNKNNKVKYNKFISDFIIYCQKNGNFPIRKIDILQTKIDYHIANEIRQIELPYISFDVLKKGSTLNFISKSQIRYGNKDIIFNVEAGVEKSSGIYITSSFHNLETGDIVDFIPELSWIRQLKQDMNGMVRVNINKNGNFKNILFSLKTLEKQQEDIFVSGKVNFVTDVQKNISTFSNIFLAIEVVNFKVNKLHKYWKGRFVPQVRNWVVDNITGGIVPHASLKLNISAEDILRGKIEGDSLYADVDIKNTSLQIPESNFKIDNIDGKIIFTSDKMDFILDKGRFLSSDLKEGNVIISGMNDINKVAININGKLYGDIGNLIKISEFYTNKNVSTMGEKSTFTKIKLAKTQINKPRIVSRLSTAAVPKTTIVSKISGDTITFFSIIFPLGNKFSPEKIAIEGISTIKNFSFDDINKGIKIKEGNFDAVLQQEKLTVHGYGYLNDIYSHIDFSAEDRIANFSIDFAANEKDIAKTEFAFLPIEHGKVNVSLSGKIKSDKNRTELENLNGTVDFSNAIINMPYVNYKSKIGDQSVLKFEFNKKDKDNNLKVSHFSSDMQFNAVGKINLANHNLQNLNITNFKIKDSTDIKTDIQLEINKNSSSIYDINIRGKSLDLSKFFSNISRVSKNNIDTNFNMTLMLENILAKNNIEFSDVNFQLSCAEGYCNKLRLRGSMLGNDDNNVLLDYMPTVLDNDVSNGDVATNNSNDNIVRVLSLKTNNAGLFFSAIGMNDRVIDGKINLTAVTTGDNYNFRDGKIIMKNFKVVKAVLLGKLLNIISIDILDLLQGAGINFKKMSGRFSFVEGILAISGLKAKGTSLGITADGSIDMKDNKYDLDGAIIPAYFFNSLLGRIPLLGSIFVGKEGEGVIASRYIVRGDYDNPTITVNPFSMLTPGFLRNIWGGKSEKEMDKKMQE